MVVQGVRVLENKMQTMNRQKAETGYRPGTRGIRVAHMGDLSFGVARYARRFEGTRDHGTMPRKPRVVMPGQPHHVLQRGNNRQAIFFSEADYRSFLEALQAACERYGCVVHAYALMTNHIHLLMTPGTEDGLSRVMQSVGRRYVRYINDTYRRTGTLWEGRFKCSLVDTVDYLWRCFVYIEMNPVRAGMVRAPEDYRWSSFRANGLGRPDALLTAHKLYERLASDATGCQQAYRALFAGHLAPGAGRGVRTIRLSTGRSDRELELRLFRDRLEQLPGDVQRQAASDRHPEPERHGRGFLLPHPGDVGRRPVPRAAPGKPGATPQIRAVPRRRALHRRARRESPDDFEAGERRDLLAARLKR